MLGTASIIVVDDSHTVLEVAQKLVKFYAHESCGKCVPCREGTNWTREDAAAHPGRRGDADGPRHHGLGPGARSSATACACSATRWRCRSARWSRSSARSSRRRSRPRASGSARPSSTDVVPLGVADEHAGPMPSTHAVRLRMPRPEQKIIQLTIDGREIQAVEGSMLVDAAKQGDVEIPYFCYQPKLGQPVGACRMCLVEVEGIPKLQTSCSTPVKDGMVVHTQTERVHDAQHAVVEFLLVNHPLDCPVCDKGGECPLQDITFGWGLGSSRFIEPKRHFVKPLSLSPLIAIDRERCILCYRCVRFSQEIAEDYQLIFAERGADTFVSTHDGHPYVAPFSGNIIELCPVGALTSKPYRFRARPWDIEGAGGICMLCPAQCNVEFTVRDEKVMRVLARDPVNVESTTAGCATRAASPTRRCTSTSGSPRRWYATAASCARSRGSARLEAAAGLARHAGHGGRAGRWPGHQRGGLPDRPADARGAAARATSTAARRRRTPAPGCTRALAAPSLQATVPDLEFANTVLVRRLRAARRRADPRPADSQGRAPPRREAGRGDRPAERARRPRPDRGAVRAGRGGVPGCSRARSPARPRAGEPAARAAARTS